MSAEEQHNNEGCPTAAIRILVLSLVGRIIIVHSIRARDHTHYNGFIIQ